MPGSPQNHDQGLQHVEISERDCAFQQIRATGPGGQHVNKVATGVRLYFDIQASSLPDAWKARLLALPDHRITRDGVVVIRSDAARSQALNKAAALARLQALIHQVAVPRKKRRPTRPTRAAKNRRMDRKTRRGKLKALRGKVTG
ncbi:MAG: aminoacyl-tRNA hydrolase [Deltaproteobacteria bacterium]|nr:MAG: aminoacyl-tRNA hydrolase [Deltaproteobacteria bacterium]